ncbi:MAG: hypothetical protein WCI05_11545 [Myxococcales bacterium]
MSKVALHLAQLTTADKITLARGVVSAMTDPKFPTPDVPLAELTQSADTLESAVAATNNAYNAWIACASVMRKLRWRNTCASRHATRSVLPRVMRR